MVDVRRDDHPAAGHLITNQLGSKLLLARDVVHLFGNHASTRIAHLRKVAVSVLGLATCNPLGARTIRTVASISIVAVAVISICGWHGVQPSKEVRPTL